MSSRIDRSTINSNHEDPIVPASNKLKVSLKKKSRRRVATVKRQTSRTSHSGNSRNTLYTLVNGVTGHVDGNMSLFLPSLDALFELDEMSSG